MPNKKPELQIPLQKILDHQDGNHGKRFQIKIAHYPPRWVPELKLSPGAVNSHLMGSPLPKRAWVLMHRRFSKAPEKRKTKDIGSFFGKRGPSQDDESCTPEKKKSRSDGDTTTKTPTPPKKQVRTERQLGGWCIESRKYIKTFNSILDTKDKTDLVKVINQCKDELKPNQECVHLFASDKFLSGTIIKHNKDNICCLQPSKTPNQIRCDVCDESFEFSRGVRAILHCFHKTHVTKLKKKQADQSKQRGRMEDFTKAGRNEENIVACVQKCVAQQIALKGLPFTAGVCNKCTKKTDIESVG